MTFRMCKPRVEAKFETPEFPGVTFELRGLTVGESQDVSKASVDFIGGSDDNRRVKFDVDAATLATLETGIVAITALEDFDGKPVVDGARFVAVLIQSAAAMMTGARAVAKKINELSELMETEAKNLKSSSRSN